MSTPQSDLAALQADLKQALMQANTVNRTAAAALLDHAAPLLAARAPQPIRMIHHFACSGGTLISKCIATSPNTVLFSEIDPLGTHHFAKPQRPFFTTDLVADLHYSPRPLPAQVRIDHFIAGLGALHRSLSDLSQHIVLRDHAHSHFCMGPVIPDRPDLRQMAIQVAPVRALVTVRHPLESFASIQANKFVHFTPGTLTEYCYRYQVFLDTHADAPLVRYEDFLETPREVLGHMLTILDLQLADRFEQLAPLFRLSGDSGRGGEKIAPRPRRRTMQELLEPGEDPAAYIALCNRLGYTP